MIDWILISKVERSKYRKRILIELERKPLMPSVIAKELKLSRPNVSNTLKELVQLGLVKCLTPDERMGRLYSLTAQGREVIKQIKG